MDEKENNAIENDILSLEERIKVFSENPVARVVMFFLTPIVLTLIFLFMNLLKPSLFPSINELGIENILLFGLVGFFIWVKRKEDDSWLNLFIIRAMAGAVSCLILYYQLNLDFDTILYYLIIPMSIIAVLNFSPRMDNIFNLYSAGLALYFMQNIFFPKTNFGEFFGWHLLAAIIFAFLVVIPAFAIGGLVLIWHKSPDGDHDSANRNRNLRQTFQDANSATDTPAMLYNPPTRANRKKEAHAIHKAPSTLNL